MADAIHGDTELGATKQALIASLVAKELAYAAKLSPFVTDVSMFAEPGAKSISINWLSSFTAVDRTEGAAGDATTVTATADTLLLDKNAYVAWIVDKMTKLQSKIEVEAVLAQRAAAALGRYVDAQIIAQLKAVAHLALGAGDITRDKALNAVEALEKNFGMIDQCVWVVHPDQKKALLKIADFSQQYLFGQSPTPIYSGQIGMLYGAPVVVHAGLAAGDVLFFEKGGLYLGFQSQPAMDEQPANEYGVGAVRKAMDVLFGVKGAQLNALGVGAGLSPLVVKNGA